jgi:hypothetical protein
MAVAALFVAGCSGDEQTAVDGVPATDSSFELDELTNLSAEQRVFLADGKASLSDYQTSFEAFMACANADRTRRVSVASTDEVTGLIVYGVVGELLPPGNTSTDPLNVCYEKHFTWVEFVWQTTDPNLLAESERRGLDDFERTDRPCLEANGVDVPASIEYASSEYGELVSLSTKLINEGKCEFLRDGGG